MIICVEALKRSLLQVGRSQTGRGNMVEQGSLGFSGEPGRQEWGEVPF